MVAFASDAACDRCAPVPALVCIVCKGPTAIAPAGGELGVCAEHCEDHSYEYERGTGWRCVHCDAEPPADWFDFDD